MDNRLRRMRVPEGWNSDGMENSGLNLNFDNHWHSDMLTCVVSGPKSSIIVHEGKRSLLRKNSF